MRVLFLTAPRIVDGRRGWPCQLLGQFSAFDINALPVSSIERVEILEDVVIISVLIRQSVAV